MMHCVEEVSTRLQPVQVLTGLRLLAPCSHSRYPCTLGGSETRMGEQQSQGVFTLWQPLQMQKSRSVCSLVWTVSFFARDYRKIAGE